MFSRFSRVSCLHMNCNAINTFRPIQNNGLLLTQCRTLYTINVGDLMKRMKQHELFSISENEIIRTAAQTMESEKIGALVVSKANDGNEMVGIITARDIQQAVAEYDSNKLDSVSVQHVMTPKDQVKTVSLKDNLEDVATTMIDNNIRHIPVMNKQGINCGILSIKDVVREVLTAEKDEIKAYERIVNDSYSA